MNFAPWITAARPQTLTAAIAPVMVGSALAFRDAGFRAGPALAALAGAVFIQIGTNLVNDVEDFERGADDAERLGPQRATQSGLLSPAEVRRAALITFAGAALCGIYLTVQVGWPILVLGIASILAGIAYTAGPWPLGYHGLGDLFVFLFFGLAAVGGTYFVQTGELSSAAVLLAIPIGALATAILVVNNIRDVATDTRVGKRTLAVRFGPAAARWQYLGLLAAAYIVPVLVLKNAYAALPLLSAPWAARLGARLLTTSDAPTLNSLLRDTARLQLGYAVLLAAALLACAFAN
jgi:1,4-dihydroxy-2-naphthoate octaprenyltransferase